MAGSLEFPVRPGTRRVALVLQGGGALGAYQAGVFQALDEHGFTPDWVGGTSIGAINGAITPVGMLRNFPPSTVRLTPIGQRSGLRTVGSTADFPLEFCKGCLGGISPPACPSGGFTTTQIVAGCFPNQDTASTCCTDASNIIRCGNQVPKAP